MRLQHVTARGTLTVAGIDRDVTLDVKVVPAGRSMLLVATAELLMTDFGVQPPKGLPGASGH